MTIQKSWWSHQTTKNSKKPHPCTIEVSPVISAISHDCVGIWSFDTVNVIKIGSCGLCQINWDIISMFSAFYLYSGLLLYSK